MKAFVPTGRRGRNDIAPSRVQASSDGARVLLLDNGKTNADKLLHFIGELLKQRRAGIKIDLVRKSSLVTPAPSSLLDECAAKANVVVTGVGEGGVSTSCSVLDAYEFEK